MELSFASAPSGLDLGFNGARLPTPFSRTVIQGSANTVGAPTPQTFAGKVYDFGSWSDGGVASHTITASRGRRLHGHLLGALALADHRPACAQTCAR